MWQADTARFLVSNPVQEYLRALGADGGEKAAAAEAAAEPAAEAVSAGACMGRRCRHGGLHCR